MAEMELDWAALQESAATATTFGLPIGRYPAQVESTEAKSTQNGKPMIVVRFVVRAPHQLAGRKMTRNMVLSPESPQALSIFFRHMAGLGVPATTFRPGVSMEQIAAMMVGQVCEIVVAQGKPYQGQERTEIQNIIAVAGATPGAPGPMVAAGPPMPGSYPPAPVPTAAPVMPAPPAPVAQPAPAVPAPVYQPAPVATPAPAPAPVYQPPTEPVPAPAAPAAPPAPVAEPPAAPPAPVQPTFQEPAPAAPAPGAPAEPMPARPSF